MSLVGSLEDLGLGEILQIVGLSGKSGTLSLRAKEGEGRILFDRGQVRGAQVGTAPADLATLLAAEGALPAPQIASLAREARGRGEPLGAWLVQRRLLAAETLETLRRRQVEAAMREMFGWTAGEFVFEMQEEDLAEAGDLLLAAGLSAQFLALECTRLHDEEGLGSEGPLPDADAALHEAEEATAPGAPAPAAPPPAESAASTRPPVIVIDGALLALEWAKAALRGHFPRVHIFQRTELGIARVRQYLGRGELPLVLLAEDAPVDPLSGAQGGAAIAARLRLQAPRMTLVLLREGADASEAEPEEVAGTYPVLRKPAPALLADRRGASRRATLAEELRAALLELPQGGAS